jgi:hypothetical protein
MMDNFQILPIYNTKAIVRNWKLIREGMEKVLIHTYQDANLEKIFNELMAGEALLWIWFVGGQYGGFFTTKIEEVPFGERSLWIVHMFSKGANVDMFREGLEMLDKYAKFMKCKTVRFYTQRDEAFERKLGPLGFKRGYQEFIREVKDG